MESISVPNYWDAESLKIALNVSSPLASWDNLETAARCRCPDLTFSQNCFEGCWSDVSRAIPLQLSNFAPFWILLACVWRGFRDNPAGFGRILSAGQAFRLRFMRASERMEGVLPPAKCGKANQDKQPDQEHLMPDLHTPAASSTDIFDLRPAIRDAIDDSIAKIVQIQDDEGPPAAERFEHCERQTLEVCMELGRRVLQGVLEDRDARLPDAVKRAGRVFRRRRRRRRRSRRCWGRGLQAVALPHGRGGRVLGAGRRRPGIDQRPPDPPDGAAPSVSTLPRFDPRRLQACPKTPFVAARGPEANQGLPVAGDLRQFRMALVRVPQAKPAAVAQAMQVEPIARAVQADDLQV